MAGKKEYLLRMDADLFKEVQAWASQELRSVNGQIEYVLRQAVAQHRRKVDSVPEETETQNRQIEG